MSFYELLLSLLHKFETFCDFMLASVVLGGTYALLGFKDLQRHL